MSEIYLFDCSGLSGDDMARALSALPRWRREKALGYKNDAVRRASVGAGLLMAFGLRLYGADPEAAEIDNKGKPFVPGGPFFSLSHSRDMAMAGFDGEATGVDIECTRRRVPDIARRFFSPEEEAYLNSVGDESLRKREFFRLWTARESVFKLLGTGLTGDRYALRVDLDPPGVWLRGEKADLDLAFFQLPDYTAAAAGRFDAPPRPVTLTLDDLV